MTKKLKTCDVCHGTGIVPPLFIPGKTMIPVVQICWKCRGKGYIEEDKKDFEEVEAYEIEEGENWVEEEIEYW